MHRSCCGPSDTCVLRTVIVARFVLPAHKGDADCGASSFSPHYCSQTVDAIKTFSMADTAQKYATKFVRKDHGCFVDFVLCFFLLCAGLGFWAKIPPLIVDVVGEGVSFECREWCILTCCSDGSSMSAREESKPGVTFEVRTCGDIFALWRRCC